MRDRHFMEDENELPYLVWETRDNNSSGSYQAHEAKSHEKRKTDEEKINSFVNSLSISRKFRLNLKNKIISFLNAKDCTGLTVDGGMGEYILIFTRENEYVCTTDEFVLLTEAENSQRVFHDCYSSHNHDKLLKDSRFNAMIKKSGMEFIECAGGYVTDYSRVKDDFTLKDEIRVKVYFKVGSKERMYILDLDRMELSDDYFEL